MEFPQTHQTSESFLDFLNPTKFGDVSQNPSKTSKSSRNVTEIDEISNIPLSVISGIVYEWCFIRNPTITKWNF